MSEELARKFHEIYERLAPNFGYETRPETRAFDPTTPNGRLMIAVTDEIEDALRAKLARRDEELERERDNYGKLFTALEDIYDALGLDDHTGSCIPEIDKLHAELARRDKIITRLKENAERLANIDPDVFCCQPHEYFVCSMSHDDTHDEDCPMVLHRALMKELEND